MTACVFTTSWDDGHPLDLRVAELLDRHGFKGTFYVPCRNREGLPVMSKRDLRTLSATFEIGAHTRDHVYLDAIPRNRARAQIADGKHELENAIGRAVPGFAYPGGHHSQPLHQLVHECGFAYARTTENFRADSGPDRFRIPTTHQLYPHGRPVYLRNFLKHRQFARRFELFAAALAGATLSERLRTALDLTVRNGGIFHLWGHSWELDRIDGWRVLDEFLSYAATRILPERRIANREIPRLTGNAP